MKVKCNVSEVEKKIRVILGFLICIVGVLYFLPLLIPAAYLIYSGYTGHCIFYQMMKINQTLALKNYYLSYLPNINPEPVFIFSMNGSKSYENSSAGIILASIKRISDITSNIENFDIQSFIENEQTLRIRYKEMDKYYLLDMKGVKSINSILAYGFNITDLVKKEEELYLTAITDKITGLKNRNGLVSDILCYKEITNLILVYVDIRGFNNINNYYGYEKGDELLKKFGSTLKDFMIRYDYIIDIYRVYSDVFGIMIKPAGREYRELIMRTIDNLKKFYVTNGIKLDEIDFNLTFNFGASSTKECLSGRPETDLLNQADTALSEGKKSGKEILAYCDIKDISQKYKENLFWTVKIKDTIDGKGNCYLIPFYQPIKDIKADKTQKYECLVRLIDGDKEYSPFYFLTAAKRIGVLNKITEIVLEKSFRYFQDKNVGFSVNITRQDFQSDEFYTTLDALSEKFNVKPEKVTLELLEEDRIFDFQKEITMLHDKGYKIAIDDFGTGYSNFGFHQDVPIDFLKIDGSLIKNIHQDDRSLSSLKAVLEYAKSIGAKTVAEFVSEKEIYDILKDLKVDFAQGYFVGKPVREINV